MYYYILTLPPVFQGVGAKRLHGLVKDGTIYWNVNESAATRFAHRHEAVEAMRGDCHERAIIIQEVRGNDITEQAGEVVRR